ncbi:DUF5677 domain-containing protein [Rubrobacter indicoceani]|uniref:DUF5677 domain-containing protein n=1 Tax=Rubrobacter indicoceani TaxID=2051957 RepID=UPI001F090C49|nr:DUF5677 domain-containing protein [Rubrobacter indicoceani]
MGNPSPHEQIVVLLGNLEDEISRISRHKVTDQNWFKGIKKASIAKSFEFCLEAYRRDTSDSAFFLAPSVRGICEDLITITYLQQLSEREQNRVTILKSKLASVEATEKQQRFFESERPWQPVVTYSNAAELKQQLTAELKSIGENKNLWKKGTPFPSVYKMAEATKLSEVYDFIYNISSDIVHFNARILLRMGWGEDPRDVSFSTGNFSSYYLNMCCTYGLLLFLYQQQNFDLPFNTDAQEIFLELSALLSYEMRWVESVTFEELNIEPPSLQDRINRRLQFDKNMSEINET